MRINMIFARATNGVIGNNNTIPWHLPEDMARFKRLTNGWPVIMGRKTWDSLPPKFRPLPGRTNVVITRQADWKEHGAEPASSFYAAVKLCEPSEEVWIIGGAQIYTMTKSLVSRIEVTEIAQDYHGDAFAPVLGSAFREISRETHVSSNGLPFSFITYKKQHMETRHVRTRISRTRPA